MNRAVSTGDEDDASQRAASSPEVELPAVASLSFEQALDELDDWVRQMESGRLGLDATIAAYQRAAALAQHCQGRLHAAEQELRKLDDDVLVPLDPTELRGGGA